MSGFLKMSLKYKIAGQGLLINFVLVAGAFLSSSYAMEDLYSIIGGLSLISLIFSMWVGTKLSHTVENITKDLAKNSTELGDAAIKIAAGSTQLSSAATEQSASLQETVSTVDEISSMIQKNAEAAQKSKDLSAQSKNSAEQGRQTVDSMLMAISEIESNNVELSQQMNSSNEQLSEITKMIHNISSKTKVINDIAFQTKLLSFNASVEAARAGEYGKGFAVVASEIGKLAHMSGGAAKEITDMLQDSVTRVETIVQDTKTKIDKLMSSSDEKVNFGAETAKQCKEALNEILTSIKSVDQLVTEIAQASKEQSTGVSHITKAMTQLENVTHQNVSVAHSSSAASTHMKEQATALNYSVDKLFVYISGSTESKTTQDFQPIYVKKPISLVQPKSEIKAAKSEVSKNEIAPMAKADSANTVLMFNKKKQIISEDSEQNGLVTAMKNASGLDATIPSANHPGFDEE